MKKVHDFFWCRILAIKIIWGEFYNKGEINFNWRPINSKNVWKEAIENEEWYDENLFLWRHLE